MATHSSVLAWRIPGTGEPGGLLSLGSHRVRHDWSNLALSSVWAVLCWGPRDAAGKACTRPALMGQAQSVQWWLLWVCKTAHSSLKLSERQTQNSSEWTNSSVVSQEGQLGVEEKNFEYVNPVNSLLINPFDGTNYVSCFLMCWHWSAVSELDTSCWWLDCMLLTKTSSTCCLPTSLNGSL